MPPPPPPQVKSMPPKKAKGRGDMLKSIEGFKKGKLKKAETVDKSSPLVSKPSANSRTSKDIVSSGGSSSGASYSAPPPSGGGMGGLFAGGGMPKLRKTGLPGSSTMVKSQTPPSTPTPVKLKPAVTAREPEANAQPQQTKPRPLSVRPAPPSKPKTLGSRSSIISPPASATVEATPVAAVVPSSSSSSPVFLAIYPFEAQRNTDLSIQPQDILVVSDRNPPKSGNGNWWEGATLEGKKGMFPSNYVKAIELIGTKTVLCSYQATNNDELSITKGDVIELYKKRESGWWLGRAKGNFGLFPQNFISE